MQNSKQQIQKKNLLYSWVNSGHLFTMLDHVTSLAQATRAGLRAWILPFFGRMCRHM
jgi:hypothetical protein